MFIALKKSNIVKAYRRFNWLHYEWATHNDWPNKDNSSLTSHTPHFDQTPVNVKTGPVLVDLANRILIRDILTNQIFRI